MQLLVSVRSAAEAGIAVTAGADIIDAKEPSRGSLGTVTRATLTEILERVPEGHSVSVALGDAGSEAEVFERVYDTPESRHRTMYLKLGFAGTRNPDLIHQYLRVAREATAERPVGVVAVAYVDAHLAGTAVPEDVCRVAKAAGIAGILLDTYEKSAGYLLTWVEPQRLAKLLETANGAGLLTAVAGGLRAEHLSVVMRARPDIVGFRGAACEGGRGGSLSEQRVGSLRRQLLDGYSGFVQAYTGRSIGGGETPGGSAIIATSERANPLEIND